MLDDPSYFSLYLVYDSGRTEKCGDGDFPLITRLKAGPDDNVAKLCITETNDEARVDISAEVSTAAHIVGYTFNHTCHHTFNHTPDHAYDHTYDHTLTTPVTKPSTIRTYV